MGALVLPGCSTAPPPENRESFTQSANAAKLTFENRVPGLKKQIEDSGGYIIFPNMGQWGFLFGGGRFGRGLVCAPDTTPVGFASVNTGSLGLQAGAQGFRMLMVLENDQVMRDFQAGRLEGNATGVVVVGEAGTSETAPFGDGVAVYQAQQTGLMAGVNIGLDWVRFQPK